MSKAAYGRLAKEIQIREFQQVMDEKSDLFVTRFIGLDVNSISALRKSLRANNVKFCVMKNSLTKIALQTMPHKEVIPMIDGMCGLAVSKGDMSEVSRVFVDFMKVNEKFEVCGAFLDGMIFSKERVKFLAGLPTKKELLGKLVGGLQAPIAGMVYVLKEATSGLVRVLNRIKETKEKS